MENIIHSIRGGSSIPMSDGDMMILFSDFFTFPENKKLKYDGIEGDYSLRGKRNLVFGRVDKIGTLYGGLRVATYQDVVETTNVMIPLEEVYMPEIEFDKVTGEITMTFWTNFYKDEDNSEDEGFKLGEPYDPKRLFRLMNSETIGEGSNANENYFWNTRIPKDVKRVLCVANGEIRHISVLEGLIPGTSDFNPGEDENGDANTEFDFVPVFEKPKIIQWISDYINETPGEPTTPATEQDEEVPATPETLFPSTIDDVFYHIRNKDKIDIPPHSAVEIFDPDEDDDEVKTVDDNNIFNVRRPTKSGLSQVFVTGNYILKKDEIGIASQKWPNPVVFNSKDGEDVLQESNVPKVGDKIGTVKDSFEMKKGKKGFVCMGTTMNNKEPSGSGVSTKEGLCHVRPFRAKGWTHTFYGEQLFRHDSIQIAVALRDREFVPVPIPDDFPFDLDDDPFPTDVVDFLHIFSEENLLRPFRITDLINGNMLGYAEKHVPDEDTTINTGTLKVIRSEDYGETWWDGEESDNPTPPVTPEAEGIYPVVRSELPTIRYLGGRGAGTEGIRSVFLEDIGADGLVVAFLSPYYFITSDDRGDTWNDPVSIVTGISNDNNKYYNDFDLSANISWMKKINSSEVLIGIDMRRNGFQPIPYEAKSDGLFVYSFDGFSFTKIWEKYQTSSDIIEYKMYFNIKEQNTGFQPGNSTPFGEVEYDVDIIDGHEEWGEEENENLITFRGFPKGIAGTAILAFNLDFSINGEDDVPVETASYRLEIKFSYFNDVVETTIFNAGNSELIGISGGLGIVKTKNPSTPLIVTDKFGQKIFEVLPRIFLNDEGSASFSDTDNFTYYIDDKIDGGGRRLSSPVRQVIYGNEEELEFVDVFDQYGFIIQDEWIGQKPDSHVFISVNSSTITLKSHVSPSGGVIDTIPGGFPLMVDSGTGAVGEPFSYRNGIFVRPEGVISPVVDLEYRIFSTLNFREVKSFSNEIFIDNVLTIVDGEGIDRTFGHMHDGAIIGDSNYWIVTDVVQTWILVSGSGSNPLIKDIEITREYTLNLYKDGSIVFELAKSSETHLFFTGSTESFVSIPASAFFIAVKPNSEKDMFIIRFRMLQENEKSLITTNGFANLVDFFATPVTFTDTEDAYILGDNYFDDDEALTTVTFLRSGSWYHADEGSEGEDSDGGVMVLLVNGSNAVFTNAIWIIFSEDNGETWEQSSLDEFNNDPFFPLFNLPGSMFTKPIHLEDDDGAGNIAFMENSFFVTYQLTNDDFGR